MEYITNFNAKRIIRKIELHNLDLEGNVYKKPIYFFSRFEKNILLLFKELCINPERFFNEYYVSVK